MVAGTPGIGQNLLVPAHPDASVARVVLLAGPSGSGKSRLADRSRLTVLKLDDFYRRGPDLRHRRERPVRHPNGAAGQAGVFVAEGIFVSELVRRCSQGHLLDRAVCVRRSRWISFGLRLFRDLREHRKPPLFLLRRGLLLARREPAIVRRSPPSAAGRCDPRRSVTTSSGSAPDNPPLWSAPNRLPSAEQRFAEPVPRGADARRNGPGAAAQMHDVFVEQIAAAEF